MAGHQPFTINHYYSDGSVLGAGNFGTVFLGYKKEEPSRKVAIKVMDIKKVLKDPNDAKAFTRLVSEIRIQKSMDSPYIVRLEDVFKDGQNVFLVMELCWGDLTNFMTKGSYRSGFSEKHVHRFMQHFALGLKAMRDSHVMHRDLKPQNLLMSSNDPATAVLKISDFGFARALQDSIMTNTLCGSPLYMAPEILQAAEYSSKADLWSVGCIFYEMLTGAPPYPAKTIVELIQTHNRERDKPVPLTDVMKATLSPYCLELLTQLLQKNPHLRISWQEFFRHDWLDLTKEIARQKAELSIASMKDIVGLTGEEVGPQAASSTATTATKPVDTSPAVPAEESTISGASAELTEKLLALQAQLAEESALRAAAEEKYQKNARFLDALRDIQDLVKTAGVPSVTVNPEQLDNSNSPSSTVQTVKQLIEVVNKERDARVQHEASLSMLRDIELLLKDSHSLLPSAPSGPSSTVQTIKQLLASFEAERAERNKIESRLQQTDTEKLTIGELTPGCLALFCPSGKNFVAYSKFETPYFLHPDSIQHLANPKSNQAQIVRVLLIEEQVAAKKNPFKLDEGSPFFLVTAMSEDHSNAASSSTH